MGEGDTPLTPLFSTHGRAQRAAHNSAANHTGDCAKGLILFAAQLIADHAASHSATHSANIAAGHKIARAIAINRAAQSAPDNAAAYNAVDRAESEPDVAMAVNADGPASIARHCRKLGLPFIHMSTDCVFDGTKASPYVESDAPHPLSAYGRSKLAGEQAVLGEDADALVARVCWVFSEYGENFVSRILDLARTRPSLRVVSDQVGPPTHAGDIAAALLAATRVRQAGPGRLSGLIHFAAPEVASRSDMALAIMAASGDQGGPAVPIEPTPTAEFPTPAKRPLNAHLSTSRAFELPGLVWRPWREAIPATVAAILGRTDHG
jgi:dTDP-4-dehydrorhamnose reductase